MSIGEFREWKFLYGKIHLITILQKRLKVAEGEYEE
nr:MAG TPA: hypothetical protein [Caudoviricetes sp.]